MNAINTWIHDLPELPSYLEDAFYLSESVRNKIPFSKLKGSPRLKKYDDSLKKTIYGIAKSFSENRELNLHQNKKTLTDIFHVKNEKEKLEKLIIFLNNNQQLNDALNFNIKKLVERKKRASWWLGFSAFFNAGADLCFALAYKFSDGVLNAFLNGFYNGFAKLGNIGLLRAIKQDPSISEHSLIKIRELNKTMAYIGVIGLISCSVWLVLTLTLSPLAPIFGLIGATMVAIQSISNSLSALKDFFKEQKQPKESFVLRLLNKGSQALSSVCAVAFNVCWVIGAAIAITNPVGWVAAATGLFITGLVFLGVSLASTAFKYWSENKIKKIEANLLQKSKVSTKTKATLSNKLQHQRELLTDYAERSRADSPTVIDSSEMKKPIMSQNVITKQNAKERIVPATSTTDAHELFEEKTPSTHENVLATKPSAINTQIAWGKIKNFFIEKAMNVVFESVTKPNDERKIISGNTVLTWSDSDRFEGMTKGNDLADHDDLGTKFALSLLSLKPDIPKYTLQNADVNQAKIILSALAKFPDLPPPIVDKRIVQALKQNAKDNQEILEFLEKKSSHFKPTH